MNYLLALLITIILLLINYPMAFGNPYVKNLHKKCLSNHQKCQLACAGTFIDSCTSQEAILCADNCIDTYKNCEKQLDAMRCLMRSSPVLPEYNGNFIPEELKEKPDD